MFTRELAVGFANFVGAGRAVDAERLIIILRHSHGAGRSPPDRLLFVVDIDKFSVDDIIFGLFSIGRSFGSGRRPLGAGAGRRFIHGFGQLMARLGQPVDGPVDVLDAAAFHSLFGVRDGFLNVFGVGLGDLIAMLLEHLFHLVDHGVGPVPRVDFVAALTIFGRVGFGVLGHFLHFLFAQAGRRSDGDLLLIVGGLVLGGDVENSVGVDIKGHFDLRNSARGGRNANQLEHAEHAVIAVHGPLALVDFDFHRSLRIGGGREDLAFASGNGGVAFNQLGEDAA